MLATGILAQGVRAALTGWIPSGDDGFWSLMSRAVLSSHPPLLGSSSSGSTAALAFHHLGPLGFYLLAPFVAVFGSVGTALGSAVINAASAVVAAVAVRAGLGARAGWLALCGSALLAFAMGSELLVDPWNPHLATVPFWCACCCALAVLAGRTWWAAPGMLAASLSLQTHLSFAPLSGLVGLTLLAGTAYWAVRSSRAEARPAAELAGGQRGPAPEPGPAPAPDPVTTGWRPLIAALVVTVLANLIVLIQQFFGAGPGNLTRALAGSSEQTRPIGRIAGLRVVSQPFDPANWLPGSWSPQVVRIPYLASPWLSVLAVLVLVALGVLAVRAVRPRTAVRLGFAVVLVVAGWWVAGRSGFRIFGASLTLARWAWPLALLAAVVAIDSAVELWSLRGRRATTASATSAGPVWRVGALALVVLLVAANLVSRDEGSGAKVIFRAPIQEMLDEAGPAVEALGRPHLVTTIQPLAAEATVALMDWLDARGVPFTLDDAVALRQAGEHHQSDGSETATVRLRGGIEALGPTPEGYRTIYRAAPVSDATRDQFLEDSARTEQRLTEFLATMAADPELRARVGPAPDSPLDVATYGWAPSLCGDSPELPFGSEDVERDVISDGDRRDLCAMDTKIFNHALAVDVATAAGG